MSTLLDAFSVVAIVAGGFFYLAGTVGPAALPGCLHPAACLTKADNLGLVFVVLGLLPQVGSVLAGLKLILVWLLVMLSSAAVSQLIARSVRRQDPRS